MDIIKSIEHEQMKNKIPELRVGNTVKVHVRVKRRKQRKNPSFRRNNNKSTRWRSKPNIYS